MKNSNNWNWIISVIGLGFVAGGLSSVLKLPDSLIVAVGLGLMLGGVFRELKYVNRKIAKEPAGKTLQ
jgi:hypothetical protein